MSQQAAAYINLEVYEDSVNLLGVAKVQLPTIRSEERRVGKEC